MQKTVRDSLKLGCRKLFVHARTQLLWCSWNLGINSWNHDVCL